MGWALRISTTMKSAIAMMPHTQRQHIQRIDARRAGAVAQPNRAVGDAEQPQHHQGRACQIEVASHGLVARLGHMRQREERDHRQRQIDEEDQPPDAQAGEDAANGWPRHGGERAKR